MVCDQHNMMESAEVNLGLKLGRNTLLQTLKEKMSSQARIPTGNCQTVITWEMESIPKEVVKLLSKTSITAVHGGRVHPAGVKSDLAPKVVQYGGLSTSKPPRGF